MVCNVHARPQQGLCPYPCACHPPSGRPHLPPSRPTPTLAPVRLIVQKTRLLFILPKFSHLALLPPAGLRAPVLVYMAAEGYTLPYFQETVQTYMPVPAMRSAGDRLFGYRFSSHQSGHRFTLPEPHYGGETLLSTENLMKITSHQLLTR